MFWAVFWFLALSVLLGALMARVGSDWARLGAGVGLGLVLLGLLAFSVRESRVWRDPRRVIRRVLAPTDPELSHRALRAQKLAVNPPAGESEALATFHYERLLQRASIEAVEGAAKRRARIWRAVWIVLAVSAAVCLAPGPLRIVEGMGVLVARRGVAPFELAYLDETQITAELPSYLRKGRGSVFLGPSTSSLPVGSVLTLRARPRVADRQLVLTDGVTDVPLVSDGRGGVVARWTVADPVELRVAAQFGDVKIYDPLERVIAPRADSPPIVLLQGAPRTIELADLDRLELGFLATDDHGLEQIDLVLRSGRREDRRQLVKLDGQETSHRGGHALTSSDAFLRRMFLPVSVTIEAKDNDPIDGPKWGRSPAIVIRPPPVGQPEAKRHVALKGVRDALVELLSAKLRDVPEEEYQAAVAAVDESWKQALEGRPGGLEMPRGVQSFVDAQLEALRRPGRQRASPEAVLLAMDVLIGRLSVGQARAVSMRLADVVEEVAVRARDARSLEGTSPDALGQDIGVVLGFAEAGADQLGELGTLGRDLGSVAHADLGRVRRSLDEKNFVHAEAAALHLAARLRRPNPSFGSAASGGVESGMPGRGSSGQGAPPSSAPSDFDELAGQLDGLSADHAQQISELDRLIEEAARAAADAGLRQEAEQRAQALREAVRPLPEVGGPDGARGAAAQGRGHGEAMADNLEQLDLESAAESGRAALEALDRAQGLLEKGSEMSWMRPEDVARAKDQVRRELEAVERELEQHRRRTTEAAQQGLEEQAAREAELSERARELAQRGSESESRLPQEAIDSLREAARLMQDAAGRLAAGDPQSGLELQNEAQRNLERARTGRVGESDSKESPGDDSSAEGNDLSFEGEVPGARDKDAAEDFRRRVQRGLGRPSGRLGPAVRRYAEALQ